MTTTRTTDRITAFTVPVKVLALFTFLGTLFLDWQRVSVEVAGVVHTDATTIGWNGWGVVAGLIALALLTFTFADYRRGRRTSELFVAGVLPLALVIATALAVFTGDADVGVAGIVAVEVDTTLWAAWLGLGLAVLAAAAFFVELVTDLSEPTHRIAPTPTG